MKTKLKVQVAAALLAVGFAWLLLETVDFLASSAGAQRTLLATAGTPTVR